MATNNREDDWLPSNEDVRKFEMLFQMLKSDISEIRELSKKKQDEPLNPFKVKIVNQKLEQVKVLLENEPAIEFLALLDVDILPTNSDAVLMMTQFENAMVQFKRKYYQSSSTDVIDFDIKYKWKTRS